MKSNTFKEYIAPVVVLVAICLVVTGLLAFVNSITAPIIEANSIKAANEARAELLPAADTFTAYEGKLHVQEEGKIFVTECYVADNGSGMVVTVKTKSFGGLLTEMIGLDKATDITAKGDANVNHVSGATISSNAVHAGVYAALEQQKIVGGAK